MKVARARAPTSSSAAVVMAAALLDEAIGRSCKKGAGRTKRRRDENIE